jgi:phosphatidylserine synthase
MDIPRQKRRLAIALAITGVCLAVALAAIVGSFSYHIGWMLWVFGAAMLAGFASHGWLMWGVMREGRS